MKPEAIYRVLASWWLTACLLLAPAAAYLFFSLGGDPYARWVRFLLHTPVGLFCHFGLIVNLLMASIRVILNGIRVRTVTPDAIQAMDAWTELPARDHDSLKMASWIKGKGFRIVTRQGVIHGVLGRYSFLPGTVMRAGFLVLLISLLVSVHTRETAYHLVHEGERADFFGSPFAVSAIEAGLPQDFLQVGDDGSFLLEKARTTIASSGRTYTVEPGFPTRINGNYFRMVHLGYAQTVIVRDNGRGVEKRIYLDILPPGKSDSADAGDDHHFLSVSLEPDRTISKGLLSGKQYNLAAPFYRVSVQPQKGKSRPETFTIRPGERYKNRGLDLSFGKNSLYARLQIVRDPALAGIYSGSLLTLAGLLSMLSRFFWFRKEMTALVTDSAVAVGYREEFFKKWGIQKFHRWKDELSEFLKPES